MKQPSKESPHRVRRFRLLEIAKPAREVVQRHQAGEPDEIDHAVRRALTEPDHANDGEQPEVGDVVRERGLAEDLEDASDWVRPESYALDSRQGQQVAADHEE